MTKAIIADPMRLYALGLRTLLDMAVLVHIGRCGIVGTQRQAIATHLRVPYDAARQACDRLTEHRLIVCASRLSGPGAAYNMVCSQRGWKLLTEPADFSLFPHAQIPIKKV